MSIYMAVFVPDEVTLFGYQDVKIQLLPLSVSLCRGDVEGGGMEGARRV